jgi:glycosyltransferase involved in cell wall biosynthesis
MQVSVVVPARNAAATLGRTLECLAEQRGAPSFEVVVVDDGSTDDTASVAARAGARVVSASGVGSGAARNLGVAAASGELLAFTDADCFPEPGWLAAGAAALGSADLVAGLVRPDVSAALGPFDRTVWVERETGLYETANLFVRRSLFERVGGFEPWLRDAGPRRGWTNPELGEDVWLGWRARRAGARSAFEPGAVVQHAVHRRGAGGYVSERRRARHFPAMAARVPELRSQFFYRRVFLSRRSAAFDLAMTGATLAVLGRSRAPLALAVPYAAHLFRRARPYRKRGPLVAAVDVAADATSFAALTAGSVRSRTLVI